MTWYLLSNYALPIVVGLVLGGGIYKVGHILGYRDAQLDLADTLTRSSTRPSSSPTPAATSWAS